MPDFIQLQATGGANAQIHPQGAHVAHWMAANEHTGRLFVSERAVFAPGVPIRGGVPVIFPQFAGEGPLIKHGFARTAPWQAIHAARSDDGRAQARFLLRETPETLTLWPHTFLAELTVSVGGPVLEVCLAISNTGTSPFTFTAALHTYLAVNEIADARLLGLEGCHYRDTADGGTMKQEQAPALSIVGEVDRNYFATPARLTLQDSTRGLCIEQRGFADTVVWNPGAARSAGFKDLAADDYRGFLCVEAATIQQPVTLAAGDTWQGSQTLTAIA